MDELQDSIKQLSFGLFNSLGIVLRDSPKIDPSISIGKELLENDAKLDELVGQLVNEHNNINQILIKLEKSYSQSNYLEQIEKLQDEELEINEQLKMKINEFDDYTQKIQELKLI